MLSSRAAGIQFPYVEGLRLDEAMHPLALLAVGLWGETLPNQNGAPLRLVLPWKVWLQEHHIDYPHSLYGETAGHHLGHRMAGGVRLLFQRQPAERPPQSQPEGGDPPGSRAWW